MDFGEKHLQECGGEGEKHTEKGKRGVDFMEEMLFKTLLKGVSFQG